MKLFRNIIEIDRDRCNGCGQCVLDCAEGAIAIIDGKATVVSDSYCDGLGACLSGCPQGALSIVQREAAPFDEEAALRHAASSRTEARADAPKGCPGSAVRTFPERHSGNASGNTPASGPATMSGSAPAFGTAPGAPDPFAGARSWPVKLRLVPPSAPFLRNADLLLAADCSAAASPHFHELAAGKVVLIACPKFEEGVRDRLTELCRVARPASLTVLRMEVPCCRGLAAACRDAASACGDAFPVHERIMGCDGRFRD